MQEIENITKFPQKDHKRIQLNDQNYYFIPIAIFIFFLISFSSSYYTVEPEEEAVVLRFGKYLKTSQPGLHFKLPLGIDSIEKIKTKTVHQEEFGFRSKSFSGKRTTYNQSKNFDNESLMLTGDLNVADVEWVVQYQISDPFKFIFGASNPTNTIRDISQSIMRRVVGDRIVSEVLTTGRVEIADNAKVLMQELIDKYDIGVRILNVRLQDVNPPEVVKQSFNDVNSAKQEQEKAINVAERNYNLIIPEARGKAEKLISEAEGKANALINRAKGDANKFSSILEEYKKAPEITKKRIYIETMENLFSNMQETTIIDSDIKGVLPIFSKSLETGKK